MIPLFLLIVETLKWLIGVLHYFLKILIVFPFFFDIGCINDIEICFQINNIITIFIKPKSVSYNGNQTQISGKVGGNELSNKKTYLNKLFARYNNIYGVNESSNHSAINLSNITLVLHYLPCVIVMKSNRTSDSFRHTGWGIMSNLAPITSYGINYCNMQVCMWNSISHITQNYIKIFNITSECS